MKYLIGNVKMNLTLNDYKGYLKSLNKFSKNTENKIAVMVPSPYLYLCKKYLNQNVGFGAQNCHFENQGAFTGEVSVQMLKDFDVTHCIVGHSERRTYFSENDEAINKKIIKLLENEITPILCIGETLAEKEDGKTKKVLKSQINNALKGVENVSKVLFAYEPVWAIGTGKTPTNSEIKNTSKYIKELISKLANIEVNDIILLYGGSMNDKNASEILSIKNIDGGLIGGACLDVKKFETIINAK